MLLSLLLGCALKIPEIPPSDIDIQPYRNSIDWTSVEEEAAQLLSAYVQVDTTNPPGNETLWCRISRKCAQRGWHWL